MPVARRRAAFFVLTSLVVLSLQPAAFGRDRDGVVAPNSPFVWTGASATGSNTGYDPQNGAPCGKQASDYCDDTLIRVDVPSDYWAARSGGLRVTLDDYAPDRNSDFDLYVYASDENGNRGALVASSTQGASVSESASVTEASGYYLVRVVYYSVARSSYRGTAELFERAKLPPDVDIPPGLQERVASDPTKGFRSHSEPHLAQSPIDYKLLVGGSKFYNRDPDSLAEYEFKIGTYVSFDAGNSWRDLGQLRVCPADQAPPSSWPDNTCYPTEDPARGGTGSEDANDTRGQGDFGEEYITSDVWVQMDDEGNAYTMVLDAPPGERGWGMSFHRWKSVSRADLATGKTWGRRIAINAYRGAERALFLDDKNTFAVNNAGRDRDGRVGNIVACWGRHVFEESRQQIVCERSIDGGRSWPGKPLPISAPGERFVVGVHVLADRRDPNTFYAVWLNQTTNPDEMRFARSTDGGRTWSPPVTASTVLGLPRAFPDDAFRNLSIPIMAASPDRDLFVTYSEYRAAPDPATDEDDLQADIVLIRSSDGGNSWSAPVVVNQDATNADQFQPYVDVDQAGQVNVAFFDRRNDVRVVENGAVTHPGNFFIDQYLARSNDDGRTFSELRLSHEMWDPSINPPLSTWGYFIGDYQGLVADSCEAVTLFNDTHLANPPERDPEFDEGLVRSSFQEVFAWLAPNSAAGARSDELSGGRGRDRLCGFDGSDALRGRAGRDVLDGGNGNDVLVGGRGFDRCIGGAGEDRFRGCEARES